MNHMFMAIYAVCKLSRLNIRIKTSPLALRLKLLVHASGRAHTELQQLRATA